MSNPNQIPPLQLLAQRVDVLYQMIEAQNRIILYHGYRQERMEAWASSEQNAPFIPTHVPIVAPLYDGFIQQRIEQLKLVQLREFERALAHSNRVEPPPLIPGKRNVKATESNLFGSDPVWMQFGNQGRIFFENECVVCTEHPPCFFGRCGHAHLCRRCTRLISDQALSTKKLPRCPSCRQTTPYFKFRNDLV